MIYSAFYIREGTRWKLVAVVVGDAQADDMLSELSLEVQLILEANGRYRVETGRDCNFSDYIDRE